MTDTPIIDAAVAAANDINHPTFRDLITAALRAALPWDRVGSHDIYKLLRELYPERFL